MSEAARRSKANPADIAQQAARIAALESQLGRTHEEIARLIEALRQCARMKTIKSARQIVADVLGE